MLAFITRKFAEGNLLGNREKNLKLNEVNKTISLFCLVGHMQEERWLLAKNLIGEDIYQLQKNCREISCTSIFSDFAAIKAHENPLMLFFILL